MSTAGADAVAGFDIRSRAFIDGEYVDHLPGRRSTASAQSRGRPMHALEKIADLKAIWIPLRD